MLKQAAGNLNAARVTDAALAASRQVWLAGLGAAIVTRDWARSDAGHVFRALIKEGEAVETRAVRIIGKQIDSSLVVATSTWNKARHTALSTVNGLIDTAATAWPRLKPPVAATGKSPAKRKKVAKARRAKRSGRKA
ncbi:MAG TPA: phasin family protein [Casimicrobiaceae bacterium]|nr:phasin family protein [Casimicrobiaceae bacterium]